jgi:hypothetical protein
VNSPVAFHLLIEADLVADGDSPEHRIIWIFYFADCMRIEYYSSIRIYYFYKRSFFLAFKIKFEVLKYSKNYFLGDKSKNYLEQ